MTIILGGVTWKDIDISFICLQELSRQIHSLDGNEYFPLYIDLFSVFSVSLIKLWLDWTMRVSRRCLTRIRNCLPFASTFFLFCFSHVYLSSFEYTKEAIRIIISKKNRQHNDQKKKYKRTNNDLQHIHIKLKIE